MAGNVFIPFNHQPVTVSAGTSYTVPAGKYARVTVTLAASIRYSGPNFAPADGVYFLSISETGASESTSLDFWLDDGDVVAFTLVEPGPSTSIAGASSTGNYTRFLSDVCTAKVTINGTDAGYVVAAGSMVCSVSYTTNASPIGLGSLISRAQANLVANEYYKITGA